jgi:hypothetical protein
MRISGIDTELYSFYFRPDFWDTLYFIKTHPHPLKNKFNDIRPVNKKYTSNDGGDYRARVCNVGIGAFLHELGHHLVYVSRITLFLFIT